MNLSGWLVGLRGRLTEYLLTLQVPGAPGRFMPCKAGATEEGQQVALGFSCFALKTYYTLGLWDTLPLEEGKAWIAFLRSFQISGRIDFDPISHNAFIDPPVRRYLAQATPWYQRLKNPFRFPDHWTYWQKVIFAETKQVIATLIQVEASAQRRYQGFPLTPDALQRYLSSLDWAQPWGAGGQAAAMAVFLKKQFPTHIPPTQQQKLIDVMDRFYAGIVNAQTGGYFIGDVPAQGQLINGAMKVLTALDWLEIPIHDPDRLVDTCLAELPPSDGCHLVDAVYVLYRCLKQTPHRKAEVQAYSRQVLELIHLHHNPDGGFSYNIGSSQTAYYGVLIGRGLPESDIHATCLLAWALAMIDEILEADHGWKVIKP